MKRAITKLAIIGSGGHAKVVIDAAESYDIVGILDDNDSALGRKIFGHNVLGKLELLDKLRPDGCIIALGDNKVRKKIATEIALRFPKMKFLTVIHSSAIVSPNSKIGDGSFIGAGAIVSADATIGKHNIINNGAIVEHDCNLSNFVNVAPGAKLASTISVGEGTFIGIGASVIEDKRIGKNSIIGAGAVVISDIPDNVIAVGVPAEVKKKNEQ